MSDLLTSMPVIVPEYLLPFAGYQVATSRRMVVYRGRVRPEFASDRSELLRLLRTSGGDVHVETIDGTVFATLSIYRGKRPPQRLWLHTLLLILTAITTIAAGAEMTKLNWDGMVRIPFRFLFDAIGSLAVGDWEQLIDWNLPQFIGEMSDGLAFAGAILLILLSHEMGHYLMARRHGVASTLPFLLPAPFFFGTMGAVIRMRSPIIHRRALFDIGIAGPVAGLVASIAVTTLGMHLVQPAPDPLPGSEVMSFGEPLLWKWMAPLFAPANAGGDLAMSPLLLAGWFGLFLTFINLMPIGQLDGGHMWYALIGRWQKYVGWAAVGGIIGLAVIAWQAGEGGAWIGLIVLIFILLKVKHPPVIDESIRLDPVRIVVGLWMIVMFALLFVPLPIRIVEIPMRAGGY